MKDSGCRYLVIGFPSAYACGLVELLAEKGEGRVALLCPENLIAPAKIWSKSSGKASGLIDIIEGEPWLVDFGIEGKKWKAIAESVEYIFNCYSTFNPQVRVRDSFLEVRELAMSSPRLKRIFFLISFVDKFSGEQTENGKTWIHTTIRMEQILEKMKVGMPWTVVRCGIPLLTEKFFIPSISIDPVESALIALVVLHCQLDIKTLGKIDKRYMVFTPVKHFTRIVDAILSSQDCLGEFVDILYDGGMNVSVIRSFIGNVYEGKLFGGESFLSVVRKFGKKILERVIGNVSPADLLISCTTSLPVKCEKTEYFLNQKGISIPRIADYIPETVESCSKVIEQIVHSLTGYEQSRDILDD